MAQDPVGSRATSSVVFQDTVLDAPLTGRQNLELHLRLWGVDRTTGRRQLAELAQSVGISEILDRPVATYSGGQKRRLELVDTGGNLRSQQYRSNQQLRCCVLSESSRRADLQRNATSLPA